MPNRDQLLRTIRAIHSAGLDETIWPQALAQITALCGGAGGTLEIFDKMAGRHSAFFSVDMPPPPKHSYMEYWAARNPRATYGYRQKPGDVTYDYEILDEAAMDRNEFYSELLAPAGLRYFVSTTPINNSAEFAALAVQRTRRQGHVGDDEVDIMRLLTPHIQQAFDVTKRLRSAADKVANFEQSLDWLDDGIALLRHDGRVVSCNSAFATMASCDDGVRVEKGSIAFGAGGTQTRFGKALAALRRLGAGDPTAMASVDFPAERRSGVPPYIVSLRPLVASHDPRRGQEAKVIVFIRDPEARNAAAMRLLQSLFGLTPAEAALAGALQRGVTPLAYARASGLSPNTVYTHLRRLKEKTGWSRTALLSRKLNELQVAARL